MIEQKVIIPTLALINIGNEIQAIYLMAHVSKSDSLGLGRVVGIINLTVAQQSGEEINQETFAAREFTFAWYRSHAWLPKGIHTLPHSAARRILIAVEDGIVRSQNFHYLDLLAEEFQRKMKRTDILPGAPGNVFIIHGRDEDSLNKAAALIEREGRNPVILARQPARGGLTIIENLEALLPEADSIIALFTPDDEGRLRDGQDDLKPRARQNVLIEAGYALIHRRSDSIIISLGGTEVPSDLSGIRTIQARSWGFDVENKLIEALRAQ